MSESEGSSPRMRGAPGQVTFICAAAGIIPAYAGSTLMSAAENDVAWDHPRVCGEHIAVALALMSGMGSSPRMRGAHGHERDLRIGGGIIPAYAGSTCRGCSAPCG